MAKPINKAAAIREYVTKHPNASRAEVAREVGKQLGVDVRRQYAAKVKREMRWDQMPKRR